MNLSSVASCLINSSGNRGDKSSGLMGSKVCGCRYGGGFTGRSAIRLYHRLGISIARELGVYAALACTLELEETLNWDGLKFGGKQLRH